MSKIFHITPVDRRVIFLAMARPLRPDIEAVWHHVINRGLERLRIFTEERTNLHFLGTLSILPVCLGLKIHGWPEYFDHRDSHSR